MYTLKNNKLPKLHLKLKNYEIKSKNDEVIEYRKTIMSKDEYNYGMFYFCSNCGEDLPRYYIERPTYDNPFPNMESIDKTPRCPYCGAIMDK